MISSSLGSACWLVWNRLEMFSFEPGPDFRPCWCRGCLTVTQASPGDLAGWIRGHWHIEALHHREVTYGEDSSQARTGSGPKSWPHYGQPGHRNPQANRSPHIAAACRHHGRDATRTLATLGLIPA
jgi:hypothetical protein